MNGPQAASPCSGAARALCPTRASPVTRAVPQVPVPSKTRVSPHTWSLPYVSGVAVFLRLRSWITNPPTVPAGSQGLVRRATVGWLARQVTAAHWTCTRSSGHEITQVGQVNRFASRGHQRGCSRRCNGVRAGSGDGGGAGAGPPHYRALGVGLRCGRACGPDIRADRWFPPALDQTQQEELKGAVEQPPAAAGSR